jgi:hypothetical protein
MSCLPGEGLELQPEPGDNGGGWISRATNCVGIQGAIFTYDDPGLSYAVITSANGRICVAGTLGQVINNDFDTTWGAVVAVQLNNPITPSTALAYDATAYGVDGFRFTIAGTLPNEVLVQYQLEGSGAIYCQVLSGPGLQTSNLANAHPDCWEPGNTATPDPTKLTMLEFMLRATAAEQAFDFCIDGLTAIQ